MPYSDVARACGRVDGLTKIGPNWDSYNGRPTTPEAAAAAKRVVTLVHAMTGLVPWPVPTPDGGVDLGCQRGDTELEIFVSNTGNVQGLYFNGDDEEIELDPVTTEETLGYIRRLA